MPLTREDVRKVAALARLELTATAEAQYLDQLGAIVAYIDQLQTLELEGVPTAPAPRSGGDGGEPVDRRVGGCMPRDRAMANAPAHGEGFFIVPQVKVTRDEEDR